MNKIMKIAPGRNDEKALGKVSYAISVNKDDSHVFRHSIFVVKDITAKA